MSTTFNPVADIFNLAGVLTIPHPSTIVDKHGKEKCIEFSYVELYQKCISFELQNTVKHLHP
jgi:hypothetical protein